MKKLMAFLLAAVLAFSLQSTVLAEDEINVFVDGKKVEFDVSPVIVDGRTLVPVRAVFEELGASVDWDKDNQKVVSSKGDISISLTVNENKLVKNGEEIALDVPATITDGRTLVPVRAISEAYGCYVGWSSAKKAVVVISDTETTEVMNVCGESVGVDYFNYWLLSSVYSAANSFGASPADIEKMWDSDFGGASLGDQIKSMAVSNLSLVKSVVKEAESKNITVTEEQKKEAELGINEIFQEGTKVGDITKGAVEKYFYDVSVYANYTDSLLEKNAVSEKEAKKYLDENYVRAKHILITPEADEDGSVSPEKMSEAKKLAEDTLAKIKKGADFDKLMTELGKDPGVESNPDGYLFTKGEMVKEFETAAFALRENGLSGVVETTYGYHIIKRVKPNYSEQDIENIQNKLAQEKVNEEINSLYKAEEIKVNEDILKLLLFVKAE